MTFREKFMNHEAEFDEIFDLTDQWNFSDETCTLREYLGLTAQEEDIWISDSDEALEELMNRERDTMILFTDLDGTLLMDDKSISEGNRQTIQKTLEAGHIVVISTGRALPSAILQAKRLGLIGKNCYIICFNGGQVYDTYSKKLIYQQSMPMDLVRYVFDEAHKFPVHVHTYDQVGVVAEKENPSTQKYVSIQNLTYRVVDDVAKDLPQEPAKVLILDYDNPEQVYAFHRYLAPKVQDRLDLFLSAKELLEVVPKDVNKGNAVRFLCDYLGIPLCNSVSAGDAQNDYTMIEAAHVGAVMCNGVDELKAIANYITEKDNNHDGFTEIVERFILNKKK